MKDVIFQDLGLISFKEAWEYQERLFKKVIDIKQQNRELPGINQLRNKNYLLFCEHPHVYTLGKTGDEKHLLVPKGQDAEFFHIDRGGDITYHGPGQIVCYPILDLDNFFTDIGKYLRFLEEAVIRTLAEYDIQGDRYDGLTGVWLDPDNPSRARKICAMGVRLSRWVTMHGLAFNVNTDLSYYDNIVPCGISDKQVTSIQKELGKEIDVNETKEHLRKHLSEVFEMKLTYEAVS